MAQYRLSSSARLDITDALGWSFERFGGDAEVRYAALITAAIRHAASTPAGVGFKHHPEYGHGVMTWHLGLSVSRSRDGRVRSPRHVLVCRREGELLVIGRLLHDSMDPMRHLDASSDWE